MLGLVLKDILVCKKNLRTVFILVAVFAIFSISADDNSFMLFIVTIYFTMMVMTAFAYDRAAKWDAYGMTMPVSRADTVLAKYILGIVLTVSGTVLSLLLVVGFALYKGEPLTGELLVTELGMLGGGLVFMSVFIPIIYRFGPEKTRLLIIAMFIVPSIASEIITKSGIFVPSEEVLQIVATLIPFIIVGILVLSYLLSVRIFSKKEL